MLPHSCSPSEILAAALAQAERLQPGGDNGLIRAVVPLVTDLFEGRHPDYQGIDLRYHSYQHTLLATWCFIELAAGRLRHDIAPPLTLREFELGFTAIMLHDSGYLKLRSDTDGTGAKYTLSHILRSCALAASVLPALGCDWDEINGVLGAIRCTGPTSKIGALSFNTPTERMIGCMIATSDYLGQMADPHYVDKLDDLYREFEEANDFNRVPSEKRMFASAADLISRTPDFWHKFVLPMLGRDYEGVYHWLADTPGAPNPYIEAVEANLRRIQS
ncbi:MAG: hypothetical protein ABII82_15360 [Verrucomicrobiota bacterium]